jgi:hypothetical protein
VRPPRHQLGRGRAALCAACLLWSCGPSAEKQEAQRVVALVERVRQAELEGRAPELETLEKEHPKGELAKRARDACFEAFSALHESQLRLRELKQAGKPEGDISAETIQRLIMAEQALKRAEDGMPGCDEAMRALNASLR